jgi:GT2 family glycosyltransferase
METLEDCDAVLLLNPDAAPVRGIDKLAEAVMNPGIGAAAGTLTGADGRRQDGFNIRSFPSPLTLAFEVLGLNRLAPWNPVNRRYRTMWTAANAGEVEQPAAAFLMLNRDAWRSVGGFDEGFYPLWFEDVDFCYRLRERGYRILYIPEAEARHIGGHSAARLGWDSRQVFWYGSLLRYASLRFNVLGCAFVALAVMAGSIVRAVAATAEYGVGRSVRVYSEVFRQAITCRINRKRSIASCKTNRNEREGQTARLPGK